MDILKELYWGNIADVQRQSVTAHTPQKKIELQLYDTLLSKLDAEDKHLLEDYADTIYTNSDKDLEDKYIQGLKTGILIGIEVHNIIYLKKEKTSETRCFFSLVFQIIIHLHAIVHEDYNMHKQTLIYR